MSKFVVLIFSDEAKAYEGTRALKELHAEGSIALYGTAVIGKDAAGAITIKQAATSGVLGTAVGALVGGLVGLIAGPVGFAIGLTGGALAGGLGDIFNAGVSTQFVKTIADELHPGKAAVIAEISEEWVTPLDTRIEALGGVVIREFRSDVEDEQIEKEVAAQKIRFEHLKAEYAQASDDVKKKLAARLGTAKADLEAIAERAKQKADVLKVETEAKIDTLQAQAKAAASEAKTKIDQRIAVLRTGYEQRAAKLEQAWKLTKDALR